MTLRLLDLEAPLEDVEFPNGSKHVPVPFGPTQYKLWREIKESTDSKERSEKLVQIARQCYPTADAFDWDSISTATMLVALVAHAASKIEQVRDALKNVAAAEKVPEPPPEKDKPEEPEEPGSVTPPLSPKTSGSSSALNSPETSDETSGTTTGPDLTIAPTSPGTNSTA